MLDAFEDDRGSVEIASKNSSGSILGMGDVVTHMRLPDKVQV